MSRNILAYGELLWDVLPDQTILGGAPFNFAYRIHSLGEHGQFVSRLGRDQLGDNALANVKALGVNTALLQCDEKHPTGTVDVSFDENHMPDYVINADVAYDFIELTDELIAAAEQVDCLCFGTLIQRASRSRQTLHTLLQHSPHSFKFLDINLRKDCHTRDTILWSLNQANTLKLNDDEVTLLGTILELDFDSITSFCALAVDNWNLDYCLVTCGEKGAYVHAADGTHAYEPGYKIELADSLGSGDAFSAGFVHKILNGENAQSACRFGNVLGALTATKPGATTPVSTADIHDFATQTIQRITHPEFS